MFVGCACWLSMLVLRFMSKVGVLDVEHGILVVLLDCLGSCCLSGFWMECEWDVVHGSSVIGGCSVC